MNQPSDMMHQPSDAAPTTDAGRPKALGGTNVPLMIGLGCFALLVMGCLFILGVFAITSVTLRSSDAYQLALAAAQRDPSVATELGTPIHAGWVTTGRIHVAGSTGEANLDIPISGPRGTGTVGVHAKKLAGKWSFDRLQVHIPGRPTPLDLLAAAPP